MRVLCVVALALALFGCRTPPWSFGDLGEPVEKLTDQQYDARLLPTGAERVAIFERSPKGAFCAVLVIIADYGNKTPAFSTPVGFSLERAFFWPYESNCFALDPYGTVPDPWGAEAEGGLTFTNVVNGIPCGVNLHGRAASHLTEQGVLRPPDIVGEVDFDVDDLPVDDACLMH